MSLNALNLNYSTYLAELCTFLIVLSGITEAIIVTICCRCAPRLDAAVASARLGSARPLCVCEERGERTCKGGRLDPGGRSDPCWYPLSACVRALVRASAAAACHSLCRGANTGSDKDQKPVLLQLLFYISGEKKKKKKKRKATQRLLCVHPEALRLIFKENTCETLQ